MKLTKDYDTYTGIEDLPIYYWSKIHETGDLKFLKKDESQKIGKRYLFELWESIQQEHIYEFGTSTEFKQRISIIKSLVRLNAFFIQTRDRHILNHIKVKEIELKEINDRVGLNFWEQLDIVEKYKGFQIDPKKFSVKRWEYAIRNMIKQHGENKGE